MQKLKRDHIKESCEAKSPLDLYYMKRMISTLDIMGAWPHEHVTVKKWEKFMNRFLLCFENTFFTLGVIYVVKHQSEKTYVELGHLYISLLLNLISIIRLFIPWFHSYDLLAGDLVKDFHLLHFKHKSEYSMKVFLQVEMICKFANFLLHFQLAFGLFLYNITPFYNNISNGYLFSGLPVNATFEHTIYISLPFEYSTNIWGYLFMFVLNLWATSIVAMSFCANDLYLTILIFHIWGHLKILMYNLEHFPLPKNHSSDNEMFWYDDVESKAIAAMLQENIEHHRLITKFTKRLSSAYGAQLGIYYVFHQIVGCILLLQLSNFNPETFGKYGPLTLTLTQLLIQISVLFELLNSMSEKLMRAVYMVPFQYMQKRDMKTVAIFVLNSQTEFTMKGAGIIPIGVNTMVAILKNTLSFYVLLKALAET